MHPNQTYAPFRVRIIGYRYMSSKDGWCREDKEEEMQDVTSRYLVTFHGEKPVAIVHFQFVEEETMTDRDAEVAYWYDYSYLIPKEGR